MCRSRTQRLEVTIDYAYTTRRLNTAGTMIIGAFHGRTRSDVDDRRCQALATRYRNCFVQTFGTTCCRELRRPNQSCVWLVERAATVLIDIIEGEDHG